MVKNDTLAIAGTDFSDGIARQSLIMATSRSLDPKEGRSAACMSVRGGPKLLVIACSG